MNYRILNTFNFIESQWSGGSTKQLFIFPEDASYADRNFQFRMSTAKVEVPKSTFTPLPGFQRKLMILEGEIAIKHENHHSKVLKPFDVDTFSGDWNTTAVGTCVDFNVMTSESIQSELASLVLRPDENRTLFADEKWSKLFLYLVEGELEVKLNNEEIKLKNGHLMYVSDWELEKIELQVSAAANVVCVWIT